MDPVAVRPATAADGPRLAELCAAARASTATGRGGPLLLEDLGEPDDAVPVGDGDRRVLFGTVHGEPVGYASLERRGPRVRIRELWVDPAARGVGVGRALMAAIDEAARTWGAAVLESQVLPGDRAAKNFFEGEGMVSRLLVVSRPVERDGR